LTFTVTSLIPPIYFSNGEGYHPINLGGLITLVRNRGSPSWITQSASREARGYLSQIVRQLGVACRENELRDIDTSEEEVETQQSSHNADLPEINDVNLIFSTSVNKKERETAWGCAALTALGHQLLKLSCLRFEPPKWTMLSVSCYLLEVVYTLKTNNRARSSNRPLTHSGAWPDVCVTCVHS